jgi:hypothetical protein
MSKLNSDQTIIRLPDRIPGKVPELPDGIPEQPVAEEIFAGSEHETGMYLVLMKWYPGQMSAPTRTGPIVSVWWSRESGGVTAGRRSTQTRPCPLLRVHL